jgi:hypothetical protein
MTSVPSTDVPLAQVPLAERGQFQLSPKPYGASVLEHRYSSHLP